MKIREFKGAIMLRCAWLIAFFSACLLVPCVSAQTETSDVSEPQDSFESEFKELLTTIYCYCGCERMTFEICHCGTAEVVKADFRARLSGGETVEQIRTDYLDTYGPQFYAVMPAAGINLIAYIMPAVILFLIGGVVFVVLRKSKQEPAAAADAGPASEQRVTDTTLKQVEAELERYRDKK